MPIVDFSSSEMYQVDKATAFCRAVVDAVRQRRMSHMDAVLWVAEKNNIEPEMAATLINSDIKDRIRVEAADLNMLKKTGTLQF
jgi:hypothetical protein